MNLILSNGIQCNAEVHSEGEEGEKNEKEANDEDDEDDAGEKGMKEVKSFHCKQSGEDLNRESGSDCSLACIHQDNETLDCIVVANECG